MKPAYRHASDDHAHDPAERFRGSHSAIVEGLGEVRRLPMLLEALQQVRQTAQATLSLFEHQIVPHHHDEEQHLFVATIKGANKGAEKERVEELVARLVAQHRHLEQMWLQLRPSVVAMAEGRTDASPAFRDEVMHLVDACLDHTRLEERVFLPLADEILSRCHDQTPTLEPSAHLQRGSGRSARA